MARYKCPCCGQPYNGKRCNNCFYENFSEEIAHGNHTHAGEPLVVRQPGPKKRPQPTITRESDCKPYSGKKKRKDSSVKWVVVAIVLLISLLSEFGVENALDGIAEDFISLPVESLMPDVPQMLEDGLVLYENAEVLAVMDWEQGREFENNITIWLRNDSALPLSVMTENVYVNGYRMEYASFYCEAEQGEIAKGEFWLDEEELERCGISDVQQIMLDILVIDRDSYTTYDETELITLECAVPLGFSQPIDDSGMVLYDENGIRLIYRDVVGAACEEAWLEFYIENNADAVMNIDIENATVNGEEAEINLFCQLEPGTRAIGAARLLWLEDIGVDAVAQIDTLELEWILVEDHLWSSAEIVGPFRLELR